VRSYSSEQWQTIRQAGRARFVLRHGFLGRGLPFGIAVAVLIELYLGGVFPDFLTDLPFVGRLLFAVAVFTLSGSLAANANWLMHERRYADA
jgi:hypothetical protein